MKNLETFEAAAISLGIDPAILPNVGGIEPGRGKAIIAFHKLSIISEAAWKAEDQVIDWNDDDQLKYSPWFDMESSSGSGSGFSFGVYVCDLTGSHVGSRLVFPSRKAAEFVGQTHLELYRDWMVL